MRMDVWDDTALQELSGTSPELGDLLKDAEIALEFGAMEDEDRTP